MHGFFFSHNRNITIMYGIGGIPVDISCETTENSQSLLEKSLVKFMEKFLQELHILADDLHDENQQQFMKESR